MSTSESAKRLGHIERPLKLCETNPRYLEYRGKPIVLVGSTEHYAAVINKAFDYDKYLKALHANGLNVTRLFSGQYRERPGKFGMPEWAGSADIELFANTLAPAADAFIAPWPRSGVPGAADGGNKFDLSRWDETYFVRLTDFVGKAQGKGIIVEYCFFSTYYPNVIGDRFWELSPWHERNNINGLGVADCASALTLEHPALVEVQERLIQKVVDTLAPFDNVYFEICNESWVGHVPLAWQAHIARTIKRTSAAVGREFLILQEFAEPKAEVLLRKIKEPVYRAAILENQVAQRAPEVSLLAFHNPLPESLVELHEVALPRGQNESLGLISDAQNRISAWRVLMSGGAFHHGTDYSFTVGHEDGTFVVPPGNAGGGSAALRHQLGLLARFIESFDFTRMRPVPMIVSSTPEGVFADAFGNPGVSYVIYFSEERAAPDARSTNDEFTVKLDIPSGRYTGKWIDPKSGDVVMSVELSSANTEMTVPTFKEDIALRLDRDR